MQNSEADQANPSTSSEDDIEAKRIRIAQLEKDISYQKSVISGLQRQLNSYKHVADLFHNSTLENVNACIDLTADLYQFSGIQCVKLDTACVFQFLTGSKVTKSDIYAVEILKFGDQQRLGRWVMPMSIDLEDIVVDHPIKNPEDVKPFLKCLKYHIDCYSYRREQYYQLKNFLSDAENCFLDTILGYTQVHLHMLGVKMIGTERIYNIILFMGYESDKAFPSRMITETREGKPLPQDIQQHFYKYFKHFKKLNLQEAFEKVISNTRYFQWEKVLRDNDESAPIMDYELYGKQHDEEESNELDETGASRKVHKKKSKTTNVENNLNDDLTDLEVQNSGENSLHSEEEEERQRPARKVNKKQARKNTSSEVRKKADKKLISRTRNGNIKKLLEVNNTRTKGKNKNVIKEKTTVENPNENFNERENAEVGENSGEGQNSINKEHSREIENLKEKENSRERENSRGRENSRERENSKEEENSRERENSRGRENSRERENSKEKENSRERENSKEKENSTENAEKVAENANRTVQPNNLDRFGKSKKKSLGKTLLSMTLKKVRTRRINTIGDDEQFENTAKHRPVRRNKKSVKNQSERKDTEEITNNPCGDAKNDTEGISNDGSDRMGNEVEKNISLNKTTLSSKSSKQVGTVIVETPRKSRNIQTSRSRMSDVSNLSTKSNADLEDVGTGDKEIRAIATNINANNFSSSTPISNRLISKLHTTQSSEISEILSLTVNAKSTKYHTIVEENPLGEEVPREDAVSSSSNDDIAEENAYEQANELLRDIKKTAQESEAMKSNNARKNTRGRKKVKKIKKKKG